MPRPARGRVGRARTDVAEQRARGQADLPRTRLRTALPIAALPIIGLIGALVAAWRARGTPAAARRGSPVALFTAFAVLMLLWQVRAGPAAQLLAVPGATALAWIVVPWCLGHRFVAGPRARIGRGVPGGLGAVRRAGVRPVHLNLFGRRLVNYARPTAPTSARRSSTAPTRAAPSLPAMAALNRLPAERHLHPCRSRPAADHADAPLRRRRAVSPQRRRDPRRPPRLHRQRRPSSARSRGAHGATAAADLPQHGRDDGLSRARAERLLRPAGEGQGAGVAGAACRCRRARRSACGGSTMRRPNASRSVR